MFKVMLSKYRKSRNLRLYVTQSLQEGIRVALPYAQHHYVINVMRCCDNDTIKIFNERDGEWLASIAVDSKILYVIPIEKFEKKLQEHRKYNLILAFAPTKKYTEFVIEKATELGVNGIIPIIMHRSIVNKVNIERQRKTVIEAAEQCGRVQLPRLFDVIKTRDLHQTVVNALDHEIAIYQHIPIILYIVGHTTDSNVYTTDDLIKEISFNLPNVIAIVLVIGPEGGLSDDDINDINLRGRNDICPSKVMLYKMGCLTMRAETACIVGLAICNVITRNW